MPESLDIIEVVDSDPSYGPTHLFKPMSGRVDLKNWQNKVKEMSSISQRPRYMMVPLPEFHQRDAREAFVRNHPVSPYEKKDWQESLSSDQRWAIYVKCYEESLNYIEELSASLEELDKLIFSVDYCTVGGISLDDIDIWSRLRSLTLIKGLKWPTKLEAYLKNLSELGDLPLYFTLQV
jgi:glutaredoxin 2